MIFIKTANQRNNVFAWMVILIFSLLAVSCSSEGDNATTYGNYGAGHGNNDEASKAAVRNYYSENNLIDYPDRTTYAENASIDSTTLPSSYDNESELSELVILNQGKWDSCVANTTAEAIYFEVKKSGVTYYLPSIKYNWYYARSKLCQCKTPDTLTGTWIHNLYDDVNDKTQYGFGDGIPSETGYPCGVLDGTANSQSATYWNEIKEFDFGSWDYSKIKINYRQIALYATHEQVKAVLYQGKLVIFSIMLGDQFYDETSTLHTKGVMTLPYKFNTPKVGHVTIITGYDDNGYNQKYGSGFGAFKVRNSWGKDWGDNGYWYLPYTILTDYTPTSKNNPYPNTSPLNDAENYIYIDSITLGD